MKKYTVYLYAAENTIKFVFYDYEDLQNLIGYMVEGNPLVKFMIAWEEA